MRSNKRPHCGLGQRMATTYSYFIVQQHINWPAVVFTTPKRRWKESARTERASNDTKCNVYMWCNMHCSRYSQGNRACECVCVFVLCFPRPCRHTQSAHRLIARAQGPDTASLSSSSLCFVWLGFVYTASLLKSPAQNTSYLCYCHAMISGKSKCLVLPD